MTVSSAPRMTRVATRTQQLARAHQLAHDLGLETRPGKDRTEYENILRCFCRQPSLLRASRAERESVIRFLEECVADRDARRNHVPEFVSDADAAQILGL